MLPDSIHRTAYVSTTTGTRTMMRRSFVTELVTMLQTDLSCDEHAGQPPSRERIAEPTPGLGRRERGDLSMQRILVWDLPVRIFHWLLAGTLIAVLAIALATDDESAAFPWHMLLGLGAAFMVLLRLGWGLVGSRYARLSAFLFGPRALGRYLLGTLTRSPTRWVGHNPGSSYAIYAILFLVLALAVTGAVMTVGSEATEELHEVLAYVLLGVGVAHLLGVAWHAARHRENLVRSMVDGRKMGEPEEGIRSARPLVALAFVGLVAGTAATLAARYDPHTQTLTVPLAGWTVALGQHEDRGVGAKPRRDRDHDD